MATEITVLSTLTRELVDRLAVLADQPPGIAEVALSALPYGSRALLIAHEIIEEVDNADDSAAEIVITRVGREVIDACAEQRMRDEREGNGSTETRSGPATTGLTSELVDRLSSLAGEPEGVAEVALSALPYESLAALAAVGIIAPVETEGDSANEIVITSLGWQVIDSPEEPRIAHEPGNGSLATRSFGPEIPPSVSLTPTLVDRLAALAGEPDGVAEVALSALPYESLASLVAHEIIEPVDTEGDSADNIVITRQGREAINYFAQLHRRNGHEGSDRNGDAAAAAEVKGGFAAAAPNGVNLGAVSLCEGPAPSFDEVLDHIRTRLGSVPRCRQKLARPLTALGAQRWVEDPDFDVARHVRKRTLRAPGDASVLTREVGEIFSQDLDHSKPLWEVLLLDGLESGGFGLVSKVHPALLEGVSGVDLLTTFYDLTREPADSKREPDSNDHGDRSMIEFATTSIARAAGAALLPLRVFSPLWAPSRTYAQVRRAMQFAWAGLSPAPDSPLTASIGPGRRVAFAGVPLSEVKAVKNDLGGTVNDVVLALVAGALRRWMVSRDVSVETLELKALAMSMQGPTDDVPLESRINQVVAPLPVFEPDPVERVRYVRDAMRESSESQQPQAAELVGYLPDFAGPPILALVSRVRLLSRFYNLAVANLRGSQFPLYLLGRRVETMHPVLFLEGDHALAIGAVSYDGGVYVGLIGDSEALPDIAVVAGGIEAELDELVAAAADSSRRVLVTS